MLCNSGSSRASFTVILGITAHLSFSLENIFMPGAALRKYSMFI
jgi:hypothetical protein